MICGNMHSCLNTEEYQLLETLKKEIWPLFLNEEFLLEDILIKKINKDMLNKAIEKNYLFKGIIIILIIHRITNLFDSRFTG